MPVHFREYFFPVERETYVRLSQIDDIGLNFDPGVDVNQRRVGGGRRGVNLRDEQRAQEGLEIELMERSHHQ